MSISGDAPDPSTNARPGWPDVSVIVPVYNDGIRAQKCVELLLAQEYPGFVEIIVVDNGSTRDRFEFQPTPRLKCLNEPVTGSYCARNAGLDEARGEVIAFTDADCEPAADWLRAGVQSLLREPNSVVGGRIEMMRPPRESCGPAAEYGYVTAFPQRHVIDWRRYSVTANLFARRTAFAKVGAFMSHVYSGGDKEWTRRAVQKGYKLRYCDEAVVSHPPRTTTKEHVAVLLRVVGGMRDLQPGWASCLVEVLKGCLPPVIETSEIMGPRGLHLSRTQKTVLIAYAWAMRLMRSWLRLKLQFTQAESSRS